MLLHSFLALAVGSFAVAVIPNTKSATLYNADIVTDPQAKILADAMRETKHFRYRRASGMPEMPTPPSTRSPMETPKMPSAPKPPGKEEADGAAKTIAESQGNTPADMASPPTPPSMPPKVPSPPSMG